MLYRNHRIFNFSTLITPDDILNCIVLELRQMNSFAFIVLAHDGIINEIEIRADSARIATGTL